MILNHWGLTKEPFPSKADPRAYFPTACLEEALARLEFLVSDRRSLGSIGGPAGTGKTLALELLAQGCAERGVFATRQSMVGLSTRDFLRRLAVAWRLPPEKNESRAHLWRQVDDALLERRITGSHTVLLLDDADETTRDAAEAILRLISGKNSVTVVLANRLPSSWIAQTLEDRIDLRIDLAPWSSHESADFVVRALHQAGAGRPLFTEDALFALHQACEGNPRRVHRLAGFCLLAGAGQGAQKIDTPLVESVHREFAASPLPAAA